MALIGPNGAGKTTLLKTILGQMQPLGGRVRFGASVEVGYLAQAQAGLDPDETVLDAILDVQNLPMARRATSWGSSCSRATTCSARSARSAAGSGAGWRWRGLPCTAPTCCCWMSRPTISTWTRRRSWKRCCASFPGTILLVTHDRYLVQALATHIWRVAGDELSAYKGNYEEYLRQRGRRGREVKVRR